MTKKLPRPPTRNRFSDFLLFLLILLLPTQLGRHFFLPYSYIGGVRVDYLAPTIYLTDIVVFILLITNFKTALSFFMTKKTAVILGIFLLTVLLSQSKLISLYEYIKIIEWSIIFAMFYKKVIDSRLLLTAFTIGALTETILAIQQFSNKHSVQGVFYFLGERYFTMLTPGIALAAVNGRQFLRPYGTFSHPNSLAGFYLLIYFLVLTNKRFRPYFWLRNILLFLSSLLIVMSFSKTAIAVYLMLNTLYFILYTKQSCRLCLIAKVSVMTILTLIVFRAQGDPLTLQKRMELMTNAATIIVHHPLFGVGPGTYLLSQSRFVSRFNLFFNQPVHNIFLLFLAENGLLAGGLIIVFLIIFAKNRLPLLIFVFLTIALTGLFDHYWLTLQQNFLLAAAVMGVSARYLPLENSD